jgi:hypothetical protein
MIFYTHERNFGCRLREYIYKGLRTVTLENEALRVSVLVDKGTDIFEFLYKPLDVDFMWRSPWGIRNPASFVATSHYDGSAFLDFYEGGWQDCMPTGGDPCEYKGLPFGAHGETPTLPWDYRIVEDTPERVAVRFWVRTYRTPFYVEKELELERDKAVLRIHERVANEGRVTMDLMWGQHPALGAPFLSDQCVIDLPDGDIKVHHTIPTPNTRFPKGTYDWPFAPGVNGETIDLRRVGSAEVDTWDTVHLNNLPEGWYAVTNTERQVGFGMVWPLEVFPALWYWQVFGGAHAAPWYARTYNIALEPFSTIRRTVVEAAEDGSAHVLEPGESLEARFLAVAYAGMQGVKRITPEGDIIPK